MAIIYLGHLLLDSSSGTPADCSSGTALHTGKDFAVSAELNRIVSVRTSILADGGRYPLPVFLPKQGSVFGLSSRLREPSDRLA